MGWMWSIPRNGDNNQNNNVWWPVQRSHITLILWKVPLLLALFSPQILLSAYHQPGTRQGVHGKFHSHWQCRNSPKFLVCLEDPPHWRVKAVHLLLLHQPPPLSVTGDPTCFSGYRFARPHKGRNQSAGCHPVMSLMLKGLQLVQARPCHPGPEHPSPTQCKRTPQPKGSHQPLSKVNWRMGTEKQLKGWFLAL